MLVSIFDGSILDEKWELCAFESEEQFLDVLKEAKLPQADASMVKLMARKALRSARSLSYDCGPMRMSAEQLELLGFQVTAEKARSRQL